MDSECFANGQMGLTQSLMGNYDVAVQHFSLCLEMAAIMKNSKLRLDCLLAIGQIYFDESKFSKAKEFYQKAA